MKLGSLIRTLAALLFGFGQAASGAELVLGSVNDNVRKHISRFTPLVEYLETELANSGVTRVHISVLPSSKAMVQALSTGDVDFYFDSPLVAAAVAQQSEAVPVLRRWKRGVATYHSVIVAPNDSDIATLEDLKGRRIGFQDRDSTSGFLLPLGLVLSRNIEAVEMSCREDEAISGKVSYVFTEDDKNTVLWLSRGWIDAAATDPRGFELLNESFPDRFRIIARSIEVPRQIVVQRKDLAPDLAARVIDVLVSMEDRPEGAKALKKFHKTTRFDQFPDGVEGTFTPIYDLLEDLESAGVLGG